MEDRAHPYTVGDKGPLRWRLSTRFGFAHRCPPADPRSRNAAYLDLTTWGWVHVVVGVLVVLADFGELSGNVLALVLPRTVEAILAAHGRELVNR